jgi:ATP-dependent NAD(P)H-hydrate dehydratase
MEHYLLTFKQHVVPALGHDAYKGSHGGKVAIIGGSRLYSGAPHYAAVSAARAGADLVHAFTSTQSAPVLKSYSPDVIVHDAWDESKEITNLSVDTNKMWTTWFGRFDALVVGPGLGESDHGLVFWKELIDAAHDHRNQYPVVYDADALKYFWKRASVRIAPALERKQLKHPTVSGGCKSESEEEEVWKPVFAWNIATPNKMELFRLIQADQRLTEREDAESAKKRCRVVKIDEVDLHCEEFREEVVGQALKRFAPMHFLLKGETDWLFLNHVKDSSRESCEFIALDVGAGAPKRCGGQGDILAGILATFLGWAFTKSWENHLLRPSVHCSDEAYERCRELFISACASACLVTRASVRSAFSEHGRGLQASDVLHHISKTFAKEFDTP